jgi:pimeloyl-ACP methyl ester carboxylesterase
MMRFRTLRLLLSAVLAGFRNVCGQVCRAQQGPRRSQQRALYDMIYTQSVFYELEQIKAPVVLIIGDKDTTPIDEYSAPPPALRETWASVPNSANRRHGGQALVTRLIGAKTLNPAIIQHERIEF